MNGLDQNLDNLAGENFSSGAELDGMKLCGDHNYHTEIATLMSLAQKWSQLMLHPGALPPSGTPDVFKPDGV
jgi:hypothetical protein